MSAGEGGDPGGTNPPCGPGVRGDGRPFSFARQMRMKKTKRLEIGWEQLAVLKLVASYNIRDLDLLFRVPQPQHC